MGHLFITRGSLVSIATDAWLLPCDGGMHVTEPWVKVLTDLERRAIEARRTSIPFYRTGLRTVPLVDWTGDADHSRAWLTDTGSSTGTPLSWYLEGVGSFLDAVTRTLDSRPPRFGRATHLVGLPVIGTGAGGASAVKGSIVSALVSYLERWVQESEIDVVLVAFDPQMFAAVQQARRAHGMADRARWQIESNLLAAGQSIARRVARQELVLFLGAGVSHGAGLPGWNDLLLRLSEAAGMAIAADKAFIELDSLDQARIIATRLEAQNLELGQAVVEGLRADQYALGHALLASLDVREIATTNYDQLFEKASCDAGTKLAVLPYRPDRASDRWLLKMHGCVSRPADIVLTRTDYLRYAEKRAALAGIVQALLITKHMLFIGFSLTDPNFHRIADEVRRAIEPTGSTPAPIGTSLVLGEGGYLRELWKDNVDFIQFGVAGDAASAARRLDIFLDYVLFLTASSAAHLFDKTYDGVLSDGEREVRDGLNRLHDSLSTVARTSQPGRMLADLLERLGKADVQ